MLPSTQHVHCWFTLMRIFSLLYVAYTSLGFFFRPLLRFVYDECRDPTLAKCGGEAQHLEKVRIWNPPRLPIVQSSTARPKTPHMGCSWCPWKDLEA